MLSYLERTWRQASGLALVCGGFALPFLLLLLFCRMNVEVSLLRRKIQSASTQREEMMRRNRALKHTLSSVGVTEFRPASLQTVAAE